MRALMTAGFFLVLAAPALAQVTPPPPKPPTAPAQQFMTAAGESDVYEISSSQMALKKAQTPGLKRYAGMLVEHHTMTTNGVLDAAKAAGVAPPPPVLTARKRAMIGELAAAQGPAFDRVYLMQQVAAHEEALALMRGYAAQGDTPQLRAAAARTAPIVERHLAEARAMMGRAG